MDLEDAEKRRSRKKISFRSVVKRILLGRSIKSSVDGSMKSKLLMKADLPRDLEAEVAKLMECEVPKRGRRRSSLKGVKMSTTIVSATIVEEENDDEEDYGSDVFDDDIVEEFDLEDLEDAFDNFLYKLDNLDPEDLDEITSGVKSGLKSWLTFGASMSGSKGNVDKSITESESGHGPGSRLRVMFRSTTEDVPKYDEEMGPEVNIKSNRSSRAAKALAELNRGDDRLTRKAEEKVAKITGDFCNWLQALPKGEDQTVNNIPPEKIKSLFDSTNSSKLATSKVVEGLRAWAKFGAEISGATNSSIFSIAKSQLTKSKVTRGFFGHKSKMKKEKERKRKKRSRVLPQDQDKSTEPRLNLDHRNYGNWFLPPSKWEKRFQNLSDPKSIEVVKGRSRCRKTAGDKTRPQESSYQKPESDDGEKKYHSVKAFDEFLKQRKNYEPPPFLKKALKMQ